MARGATQRADGRQEQARGADAEGAAEGGPVGAEGAGGQAAGRERARARRAGHAVDARAGRAGADAGGAAGGADARRGGRREGADRRRRLRAAQRRSARSSSSAAIRASWTKGQSGAGGGAPRVPNLKPTKEVLERALGGGSVDHLEDVESGDETALSAKRWIYASFFNRVKRQVAQNWDPQTVWRRRRSDGHAQRVQDARHRGARDACRRRASSRRSS